jgi:PAS domain S-box-containing protein
MQMENIEVTLPTLSKEFESEYGDALGFYVHAGEERALYKAYELGRRALSERHTVLDMTRLHTESLLKILSCHQNETREKVIADAAAFFSEFISPFQVTFSGFLETISSLKTVIDERQVAKEALTQSEKYYTSLIENALDMVIILDGEGTLKYVSPSGERVIGYTHADFVGRNIFEFVHPDDVDHVLELFKEGTNNYYSAVRAEFRFRHKNGDWLILESTGKRLLDSPMVKGLIILNAGDITYRRNLEEIRRKYEFIVNASKELMMLVNVDYRLEAVNEACRLAFSRNREDIIGKQIEDVLDDTNLQSVFKANIDECLSGGEPRYEAWFELAGKGLRYLEIDSYPYRNPYHNTRSAVTHAIVIVRDATERKTNEDKIREHQRQRSDDLRRYAQLTQSAQEDERRRISRELHDDICQRLTAINFQMDVVEESVESQKKISTRRLRAVKKEINSLISEVRRISSNLRPSALDHFGLVTALRLLCSEFEKRYNIEVQFETNIAPHKRFDPEIEIALYRIAQEAFTNLGKHSNAGIATLGMIEDKCSLTLTVTDDGDGFRLSSYPEVRATGQHFGLINMRERTELLAGEFEIESSPGKGTSIVATVPLILKKEDAEDKDSIR